MNPRMRGTWLMWESERAARAAAMDVLDKCPACGAWCEPRDGHACKPPSPPPSPALMGLYL